jgi:hypothetical protein
MDTNTVFIVAILAFVVIVIAVLFRSRIGVLLKLPGNTSLSVDAANAKSTPLPGAAIVASRTKGSAVAEANPGEQALINKVDAERDLRASTHAAPSTDHPKA